MKRWLHSLLRIENNMSPLSIKHHTSWNESESFEPQFTVFFTYKITASWVGTSKFGRINCIELTGNWESNISIFLHEEPPYYGRNSKSNTCTFWVPLLPTDVRNQNAVLGKTTLDIHRYVGVEAMGGPLPVDPAKDKVFNVGIPISFHHGIQQVGPI